VSEPVQLEIRNVAEGERHTLDGVLESSFTGIYLRHARRTISDVETVRAAYISQTPVGLSMLKMLEEKAGYVYYIAVDSSHQGRGIGSRLLLDSIEYLSSKGATEVYASVGEDNVPSNRLFRGHGFRKTSYGEVSRKYGMLKAIAMYRSMFVVPGEILLVLDGISISSFLREAGPAPS
jgi:ribosomal protein S18 acetylase RimI-like enzyme